MSIADPKTVQDHLNRKAALDLGKQVLTNSGVEDTQFDQVFTAEQAQDDVAIASAVKAASQSSPVLAQGDDGTLYVANNSALGYGVVTPTPANLIALDGTILSPPPTPAPGPGPTPAPGPAPGPTPTPTPAPDQAVPAGLPSDGSSGGGLPSGSGSASSGQSGGTPATDAAGNPLPAASTPAPAPDQVTGTTGP